jgi:Ring finger domain
MSSARGLSRLEMDSLDICENQNCEDCSICLQKFDSDHDKVRSLPCCHKFHENCIFIWLQSHVTCPICRFPLKEYESDEFYSSDVFCELKNFQYLFSLPLQMNFLFH